MHQAWARVLGFGLAITTAACGTTSEYTETNTPTVATTSRTPEDVEVFTTGVPADRRYEEVGLIEARQSSSGSGHGQSEVIAELRSIAAEKGCHAIVITGSANTVVGSTIDGTGYVGTRKGYAATCILFTGAAQKRARTAAETTSSTPAQSSEVPAGVAGFEFAMSAAEARAACEGAGHEWTDQAQAAACSGPAEGVGMKGTVQLLPCHDAYCQILITSEPAEGELIGTVTALKQAIEKRYGAPANANTAVPQDCKETMAQCLDQRRAYLEYIWNFENGQVVRLRLGKRSEDDGKALEGDHKVRLLYTRRVPARKPIDDSTLAL